VHKQAIVVHSGGLDSSLCLALALREFGKENVLSLSFHYNQSHSSEISQAKRICDEWEVDHRILTIECLQKITSSALLGDENASTLVVGRNGLMARLAAIQAHHLGAHYIYMGVIEDDAKQMGYRDCSREYMDLKQQILRQDLADPIFEIRTPLVNMTKKETLALSHRLGILDFLLRETISCYGGVAGLGCQKCPTCKIRNEAVASLENRIIE